MLDAEQDAADLDLVAGLQRPGLAAEEPLAIDERPPGESRSRITSSSPRDSITACFAAIRRGEAASWSRRSTPEAPSSALPRTISAPAQLEDPPDVAPAHDLERPGR